MKFGKIFGSVMLISCTTIGAGVLALPTNTVEGGFYPTALTFLVCWFFMTVGAFLILEVTMWHEHETNLITMAKNTLGVGGKIFAWVTYLALLYSLLSAYLTGGGSWVTKIIHDHIYAEINLAGGVLILAAFIGTIIYLGTAATDWFNRLLALGLFIAFFAIILIAAPSSNLENIGWGDLGSMPRTVPLMLTTFGFAIVVPTLAHYLHRDTNKLKKVILVGSVIPLTLYLLWEFVMLGILSIEGPFGLFELAKARADGTQVTQALEQVLGSPWITLSGRCFALFALMSSLVGVSISLYHFLADGFSLEKKGASAIILFGLTFGPPIILVLFFPRGFDRILSFGGMFVAAILGILPVAMAWAGRYQRKLATGYQLWGGKPLLVLSGLFFSYVMVQELLNVL